MRWILMLVALTAVGLGIYWAANKLGSRSADAIKDVPTAVAAKMILRDKVVEDGELESQSTITGNCEIDDWDNKLIFLAPEGSIVEKGQVVAKFDSSKFEQRVAEQKSEVNDKKSDVDNAKQELRVQEDENNKTILAAEKAEESAKLSLTKYLKGDYVVNVSDLKGQISESSTQVDKATRDMASTRVLVKEGLTDYGSLREAEQVLKSAKLRHQRDVQKLFTLEEYEHVQSKTSFQGKYDEAKNEHKLAITTAAAKLKKAKDRLKNEERGLELMKRRLEETELNLKRHTMEAEQKGPLLYAKNRYSREEKVHEGSVVYKNQPVFILPDMTRMQVKVGIHESLVGKVKVKQSALIRVDAFSEETLRGTVESVALLADSVQSSNSYSVIVKIKSFPKRAKLKPGMSANVEILVGTYPDVLAVPIQAITSFGRKKFVFVKNADNQFERREVELGKSNTSFTAIESGLEAGEVVSLDAYQRGLLEFEDEEVEAEDEEDELVEPVENAEVGLTSNEIEGDEPPTPRDSKTDESQATDASEDESDQPPSPRGEEGADGVNENSDEEADEKSASLSPGRVEPQARRGAAPSHTRDCVAFAESCLTPNLFSNTV